MQAFLTVMAIWALAGTTGVILINRRVLARCWHEPVLRRPVLIIEADDWGAGPLEQTEQLDRIAAVLDAHANRDGQKPVMTLGLVLGVADGARMGADGLRNYHRTSLADPALAPVLTAIRRGTEHGVFALQLHGAEHYWPPALLAAARADPDVARWVKEVAIPKTEALPAALQSRWIDASELPSRPLAMEEIKTAVLAETDEFRRLFGREPVVAVPPTFIWNDSVESAWAEAGIQFVVTPGRRYEARAADGEPSSATPEIRNGDQGRARITYIVRDDYFEPARGHKAARALEALAAKTRMGRPTLLETHRANFLGDANVTDAAINELERLFRIALKRFPDVAFLSTEELASRMRRNDPWLVERGLGARLHIWLRRLWQIGRLRKVAWLTGAIVPGGVVYAVTHFVAPHPSSG